MLSSQPEEETIRDSRARKADTARKDMGKEKKLTKESLRMFRCRSDEGAE